jgi:hypothetical protein
MVFIGTTCLPAGDAIALIPSIPSGTEKSEDLLRQISKTIYQCYAANSQSVCTAEGFPLYVAMLSLRQRSHEKRKQDLFELLAVVDAG